MTRPLSEFAVWLAVGLVLGLCFCGVLHAQPADPEGPDRPSPEAQALRDAAAKAADKIYELQVQSRYDSGRIASLEVEAKAKGDALADALERLRNTPEVLTTNTVLVSGARYALPWKQAINVRVNVPGVTVYGGWVWSENGGPVFNVAGGGTGFTCYKTRFDRDGYTDTPDGNVAGMGVCVTTAAAKTEIYAADLGHINDFVKAMPGSSELRVIGATDVNKDIRLAAIYLAGCKGAYISGCTLLDSRRENVVRMSPQGDAVSSDVVIEGNWLANEGGSKQAIDARHVRGVVIRRNTLVGTDARASIVRIGDSSSLPGASGVVFEDNEIHKGLVAAMKNSAGAARRNGFYEADTTLALWAKDAASQLDINGDNVGYVPGPVLPSFKKLPPGNTWRTIPATQPVNP